MPTARTGLLTRRSEVHSGSGARPPRRGFYFNPLLVVTGWIVLATALFALRWSELYPSFTWDGALFLVIVGGAFGTLGASLSARHSVVTERSTKSWPVWLISIYFAAASVLNGGIPTVLILSGRSYDIYSFGIPYLHVGMLAFSGYYGVRLMSAFLAGKDRRLLAQYLVIIFWLGMIASRSAVSFLIFASLVLILRKKGLSLRGVLTLAACAAAFLVGFGIFGDQRLSFQIEQATGQRASPDAILSYAHASETFIALGIPSTLMWAYLYMSSPIANLMAAFQYSSESLCGPRCDFQGLFVHALMPDIVGARLASALDIEKFDKAVFLVAPDLTASTAFGSAVGYAGLLGGLILALCLVALSVVTIVRLRGSDIYETGYAILATVLFFCFFENMISFSPLSLQLFVVLFAAHSTRPRPQS